MVDDEFASHPSAVRDNRLEPGDSITPSAQQEKIKSKYQKALQDGDQPGILAALREMFINAVELKIKTTIITDGPEEIQTTINLLEGDIDTKIHKSFAPAYENVADFHKEQVNKGEQIIKQNVETLKDLTQALINLF